MAGIDASPRFPKVSVVCAWYNRAAYIRDTLDSLLAQDYPDFEVVLVNDGSPDPAVRPLLDGYDDPRLRVIHQENAGFVRAIHRAVTEARGEFIAVQGSGDLSLPGRLSAQARLLRDNPGIAIVGCDIIEEFRDLNGNVTRSEVKKAPSAPVNKARFAKANPISHGETMYRKADYLRTGGYRPFFKRAQDVDLWFSLLDFGDIGFCDRELYLRRNFLSDGVSATSHGVAIAQRYSEIARRCARERARGGPDLVDTHGENAMVFAGRSPRLADFFGRLAMKHMIEGNLEVAERLGRLAVSQDWTRVSLFSYAMTRRASETGWKRRLARRLFGRRMTSRIDLSVSKF